MGRCAQAAYMQTHHFREGTLVSTAAQGVLEPLQIWKVNCILSHFLLLISLRAILISPLAMELVWFASIVSYR